MPTKAQRREATQNRLKAMSHPLRGEILRVLAERGPISPVQIGRVLEEKTENIAYHMNKLVALDCAELVEERKVRGAVEHIYRATERSLVSTEEWEELGPAEKHWFVAEIFQQTIDDFVTSEKAQVVGSERDLHLTRTPIMVDAEGFEEAMRIYEDARLAIVEVERRSAERGGDCRPASSNLSLFPMPADR
jgi:DNA-binding transcriptional ArsR family regulator